MHYNAPIGANIALGKHTNTGYNLMRIKKLVDKNTGEKYHTLTPISPKYKKEWIAMFQESLELIAADRDLNGYALRVFLALLSKLNFDNYICIPHSDIGKITSIDRAHVTKAIGKLVKKQIIFEQEGIGNTNAYKLNPNIAWKGDVAKFEKESKRYPRVGYQKNIPELIDEISNKRKTETKESLE